MEIKYLTNEELYKSLQIEDLSLNKEHAIHLILEDITQNINIKYGKTSIIRETPIVNVKDNYDKLYYPSEDITKSSRYTRWIDKTTILRTQVTSAIPNILRNHKENMTYIIPGIVYRRDVIDKTHVGEPHQCDIWVVSEDKKYNREDLLELVDCVVNSILPGAKWRYNETKHHYTKDGIEVEIYYNGKWIEILECGLILPKLLEDNGLDSNKISGLALGLGLDRAVMIKKSISDIRLLRSLDERISKQMKNLDLYVDISVYPSIKRDISIAISRDMDDELLGDKIRNLISNPNLIEEIVIKSEDSYNSLPNHVRERLGMDENMKNVLVSIKMSSIEHTLTKLEANMIIEELYVKMHEGTKGYVSK